MGFVVKVPLPNGSYPCCPVELRKKKTTREPSDVPAALEGWPVVKPHPSLCNKRVNGTELLASTCCKYTIFR